MTATLTPADDTERADGSVGGRAGPQPVDAGEDFLDLVALDRTPHLIGGAPQDLALGLTDLPDARQP